VLYSDRAFFPGAGLFETGHSGAGGIIDTNRHLHDALEAKKYDGVFIMESPPYSVSLCRLLHHYSNAR
jgi:hypothetical protein